MPRQQNDDDRWDEKTIVFSVFVDSRNTTQPALIFQEKFQMNVRERIQRLAALLAVRQKTLSRECITGALQ